MYSERLITAKLTSFADANGWMPIRHTIEQIKEFTAYLESITSIERNSKSGYIRITKRLTEDRLKQVKRFIQNEQILCSTDEGYWSSRYAFINDEKGEIIQFTTRKSQEVFDSVCAYYEDLEVAIELFVLKARQLGISTRTALKFLHRLLFVSNTQGVMSSVQQDKSELIARIIETCLQRLPWWLIPLQIGGAQGKRKEFDNGSILSIQSGSQATGIAQGWTPVLVHISEIGDIPNPQKVLEEGLLKATHPSRKLFQVWEGTGNGNTGWQADTWRSIKDGNHPRFSGMFLPWPLATDLYPQADWLKKTPIPENWTPISETRKHVRRCEFYIRTTPYLSRVVGANYQMPREQQWYWEANYVAAVKSRTQKVWLSQMPADDTEALTGKNDLVFDPEIIEVVSKQREPGYQAYAVLGQTIDEGFEPIPEEVDYNKPRIPLHWESHRGLKYDWLLVPLLPRDEELERSSHDRVLVFEPPKQGRDYSIGIDTADGLGKEEDDRAVCNVTQSAKGNYPDIQVCEFASVRVNPPQMVGFAAALAAWYSPCCRDPRGVKFCIEQRERPGDDCQHQLKLMGFTWHHIMSRLDKKTSKPERGTQQGWMSSSWSVPLMMNRFVDAINNGWYVPMSPFLIAELRDLERQISPTGRTKLMHQQGKKDDRVRAAAQAYFTRHEWDVISDRTTKKYNSRASGLPVLGPDALKFASTAEMSVGD